MAAVDGLAQDSVDSPTAMRNVAEVLAELSRAVARQADCMVEGNPPPEGPPEPGGIIESADSAFCYVRGLPEINQAIQRELDRSRQEILTAQPDGPRPDLVLQDALDAVRDRIAANVAMRTLYQHSSRFDEPTKNYVRAVSEYGVQVRTLAEFFERMIIVDRTTAFIPGNADRTFAVLIREPAVVRFLADLFEREWDRAEPYPFLPVRAAEAASEVIPAMRESIRKLLIEGRSDKEIARRLGISLRTLQAHVAQLKQDHGAQHRLQLGYLMALSSKRVQAAGGDEKEEDDGITERGNRV
ncbi:LuxR C-terminal-related transcriptional regulator [Streptomyces sp. NPDC059168]|uniref:LuxR C-terminal-related transcriptional regulator n=1 Tax=Streptomyces sp. NPDC059168 TaxID=3346753 RepID=UPI0036CDE62B